MDCQNYQGISLLSVPGKVYAKVLNERVKRIISGRIMELQGGFREGRSCIDQIFTLKQLMEKMIEKNKKMYVAFVDLEKAYDTMSRKKLWRVLEGYNICGKLLTGIKALYEGSQACVRVESRVSQWFEIRQGVRQGCVLSPVLFNIFMDKVMREAMESWRGGVQMLNTQAKGLLFADDVAVTAEKEEDLQQNLEALDRSLQ